MSFSNTTIYHSPGIANVRRSLASGDYEFSGITSGFAFKLVEQGREHYKTSLKEYSLTRGDFVILPKGLDYQVRQPEMTHPDKVQTAGLCIDFEGAFLDSHTLDSNSPFFLHRYNMNWFPRLNASYRKLCNSASPFSTENILQQICDNISSVYDEHRVMDEVLGREVKKANTRRGLMRKLWLARMTIAKHYTSKLYLDQLAACCGLSKHHFHRLFSLCFGISPLDLQHKLRMIEARDALLSEDCSLTSLASRLGYADLAAFSRQFRKAWGTAPSKYGK